MEPLAEELFARVPPFRPAPAPEHAKAALDAIEAAERRCSSPAAGFALRGRRGAGGARRAPRRAGGDLAPRQGHDYGRSSALGRRRRHLLARDRQPGCERGRPRLLRRLRDRRHDHALLAGAAHRHACGADRHRAPVARPQLPAQGGGLRRCQDGARLDAGSRRSPPGRAPGCVDRPRPPDRGGVARLLPAAPGVRRRADQAGAHLPRAHPAPAGGRHRHGRYRAFRHVDGRHVRPALAPAELHPERRPSRLASRPASARNAPRRSARSSSSPGMPASGTTSARSRRRCAAASTRSRW